MKELATGVFSVVTEKFGKKSDPGNLTMAKDALANEKDRMAEAGKIERERTERARQRNRSK